MLLLISTTAALYFSLHSSILWIFPAVEATEEFCWAGQSCQARYSPLKGAFLKSRYQRLSREEGCSHVSSVFPSSRYAGDGNWMWGKPHPGVLLRRDPRALFEQSTSSHPHKQGALAFLPLATPPPHQVQIRNSAMNPALHNLCANYEKTGGRKTCSRSSYALPPPPQLHLLPHHLRFQVFKAVTYQSFFRSDK